MKSAIFLLIISTLPIVAQPTPADMTVSTQPRKVTVFLSGAQVSAQGKATLKTGVQTLLFDKLPGSVDPQSVQVKADANITLLSVNYRLNYLQPQDNKEFRLYEDSLRYYKARMAQTTVNKQSYIEEINMLQANRSIGGNNTGVTVAELTRMADFVRTRMNETGLKKLEAEEQEKKLGERIQALEQQLAVWRSEAATPSGEVLVQVNAPSPGSVNVELSYFVGECGWNPLYDIRVKGTDGPVNIAAKANVYQQTGQEWKNVDLTLSTGNPTRGNTRPELFPWTLYLLPTKPVVLNAVRPSRQKSEDLQMDAITITGGVPAMYGDAKSGVIAMNAAVDQTATNASFHIPVPYTIPGNGKEFQVEIQQYSIAASYSHSAIPKLDPDAFLVAQLTGWDKNELLPGDASVYFENNYVGKTWFDTRNTDDTLRISLGRDNNIVIERKQVKDFSQKGNLTGSMKKIIRSYEITVRNTRKSAVDLELEDQVPLSSNAELSSDLLESSGALYNKETGKLTWKLKLNPGESKKLLLSYSVKYPGKYFLQGF